MSITDYVAGILLILVLMAFGQALARLGALQIRRVRGTGLIGLKDRVEAMGGRIFLDSTSGSGTSLRAELQLTAPMPT